LIQRKLNLAIFSVGKDNEGTHDDKIDIKVCDFFERPETPEEAEERKKKEELNTKGKKKPAAGDKKKAVLEEV
jgi:hypothetical protein